MTTNNIYTHKKTCTCAILEAAIDKKENGPYCSRMTMTEGKAQPVMIAFTGDGTHVNSTPHLRQRWRQRDPSCTAAASDGEWCRWSCSGSDLGTFLQSPWSWNTGKGTQRLHSVDTLNDTTQPKSSELPIARAASANGTWFVYTTPVLGQPTTLSMEVCLHLGADWLKVICQSEGGKRSAHKLASASDGADCYPDCLRKTQPLNDSRVSFDDVGVDGSDAIDSVWADNGQEGHVDALLAMLLHQRHAANAINITRPFLLHSLKTTQTFHCITLVSTINVTWPFLLYSLKTTQTFHCITFNFISIHCTRLASATNVTQIFLLHSLKTATQMFHCVTSNFISIHCARLVSTIIVTWPLLYHSLKTTQTFHCLTLNFISIRWTRLVPTINVTQIFLLHRLQTTQTLHCIMFIVQIIVKSLKAISYIPYP